MSLARNCRRLYKWQKFYGASGGTHGGAPGGFPGGGAGAGAGAAHEEGPSVEEVD